MIHDYVELRNSDNADFPTLLIFQIVKNKI